MQTAAMHSIVKLPIGGGSRGLRLKLYKALHKNSVFAIENHLHLVKWSPNFSIHSFLCYCTVIPSQWMHQSREIIDGIIAIALTATFSGYKLHCNI